MNKIKVSEIFFSIQGEGLYAGTPSIFLRTFGCNFTCSGYAMKPGERSSERYRVNPTEYTKYEDLPLVKTGCDSYASWDVRFKHLSPTLTIEEIVDRIIEKLPSNQFDQNKHLIITGGEPLLSWQKTYPTFLSKLQRYGLHHLTFETNGTQPLCNDLKKFLPNVETTFSISSKLPSSGEEWQKSIKPDIVKQYCSLSQTSYFKWVVSDPLDISDVIRAYDEYQKAGINIPVYLMPAGGTVETYNKNKLWVANLAMQHGFKFSPRLQVELFGNAWNT